MRVIDWNQPSTFTDLFSHIHIHSLNDGFFDQTNPNWISSVTTDLGIGEEISVNLLALLKKNVEAIRCYHATRLFFPKKIFREGLKILSERLVVKLCKQAGYSPKKRERAIIFKRYNSYTSIRSDGTRKNIYVQLDKYRDMLCKDNYIKNQCSFFDGGEVLSSGLLAPCSSQVLNNIKIRAIPTLIYINLPISVKYLNDDDLIRIANAFFCSWFNSEKLKQEPFPDSCGISSKASIKGSHIKRIVLLQDRR